MANEQLKEAAAHAALSEIEDDSVIGIGTGSTVNYFIKALANKKHLVDGAVASSKASLELLKEHHIPIIDSNAISHIDIYVDGADELNDHRQMLKGGGGALTGEKILASISQRFVCIADESKHVSVLGGFPVAIEVIPMARSYVAREIVKLGGDPAYREGFITDHGNIILDVHNLKLLEPLAIEQKINQINGVVSNGIFAVNRADKIILATQAGIKTI